MTGKQKHRVRQLANLGGWIPFCKVAVGFEWLSWAGPGKPLGKDSSQSGFLQPKVMFVGLSRINWKIGGASGGYRKHRGCQESQAAEHQGK